MSETSLSSAEAVWRRGVGAVLARARRVDADSLGEHPERLLTTSTYDDRTIAPLYSALDELPEATLPGAFPYRRGTVPATGGGWYVCEQFGPGEAAGVNQRVLSALNNGVSALWLRVADAQSLADVLRGVLFDLAPLILDAGVLTQSCTDQLLAVLDDYAPKAFDRRAVSVNLGAAPLTSRFADAIDIDLDTAVALAKRANGRAESVRAITVDGTVFHNAGASDAQELGASFAAGLAYVRALTAAGLTVAEALGQLDFRLAATDDQFNTIAKFRAAREGWAHIAQTLGEPTAGGANFHAVTSRAMMTQRDPWANQLRITVASMAAGVGGATSVTALGLDDAIPGGLANLPIGFATRMARNAQLILLEESHLGRVADPAGGSWYVEQATQDLAAAAWSFLQRVEAVGEYDRAQDWIAEQIRTVRDRRQADIANRRASLTGINEFPNLAEAPLVEIAEPTGVHRYAASFESLRNRSDAALADTGERPQATVYALGPVAEHTARVTFAMNLLASGGIEGVLVKADSTEEFQPHAITVVCGADSRYAEAGSEAVSNLRTRGCGEVLVAGSESAWPDGDARPDGYVNMKIDAVQVLSAILDRLGA